MKTTAKLRHLRMSPRKVRLVADVIRGRGVKDAQNQLQFMNKRAALPMLKLLNSVIANAENNFKLKKDNLYILELRVDEGPTLKRWMPRAFGRASAINKRTSHISIILDEKVKTQEKEKSEKVKKDDKDKKKIDKDVKVVKSLDEVKEMKKAEDIKNDEKLKQEKPDLEDVPTSTRNDSQAKRSDSGGEIKDVRREGSDRNQQHLDTIRKKDKAGALKRMFRRKSV